MSGDNAPRRNQRRTPKDVPHMTQEQKEALCNVSGKSTASATHMPSLINLQAHTPSDLYHDPRSLVQIWRDAGIEYREASQDPPSHPQRHRRQTSTSNTSSTLSSSVTSPQSVSSNPSQALVPFTSPPPGPPQENGVYRGHHSRAPSGASAYSSPPPQPAAAVRPGSRMGNPATAFFVPRQHQQHPSIGAVIASDNEPYNSSGSNGNFDFGNGCANLGQMSPAVAAAIAANRQAHQANGNIDIGSSYGNEQAVAAAIDALAASMNANFQSYRANGSTDSGNGFNHNGQAAGNTMANHHAHHSNGSIDYGNGTYPSSRGADVFEEASRRGHTHNTSLDLGSSQGHRANSSNPTNHARGRHNSSVNASHPFAANFRFPNSNQVSPPRAMPPPGSHGNDLEDIFQNGNGNGNGDGGGGGHKRNESNTSNYSNASNKE